MSSETPSAARPLIVLVSLALALVAAGCGGGDDSESGSTSGSTSSVSCANAECDIALSGDGAKSEAGGLTITLEGTDDDKAKLTVSGTTDETMELAKGESGDAFGAKITVQRIDGDDVDVHTAPSAP